MTRTICVKGVGSASVKPDYIRLSLTVDAEEKVYEDSIKEASRKVNNLDGALKAIGFKEGDLKTLRFDIRTVYKSVKYGKDEYKRVFDGYECEYDLSLSFELDNEKLGKTLKAVNESGAEPEINIKFTVKDASKVKDDLLISAAENARKKAEILCRASGVELGELLTIDYNWGEVNIYSRTKLCNCEEMMGDAKFKMPDITPEDIDLSDTAAFVWEIK